MIRNSSLVAMQGIKTLVPFAINPDQESERNSPQRICNDSEQFDAPPVHSGKGGFITQCGHECNKKYPNPGSKKNPDCP